MKRIEGNWDGIDAVLNEIRERTGDPDAGFIPPSVYMIGDVSFPITVYYRSKRKDGTFTKKTNTQYVRARFCPFTGKPLYEGVGD